MSEHLNGQRSLVRIATAGSVDDGKSTLIGRLLHDTNTLMDDQLAAVERASVRRGDGYTNLALLTDGLRAEREQGITIDVAYRFFATPARSFIVADTPGHAQYTRNMVTGASTSDVAVVLVDARNGVVEQSRRHAYIAALLGVSRIVLAVNKMDLVGWDEEVFTVVAKELAEYLQGLPSPVEVTAIPVSALHGDNIVKPSINSDWYQGPTLLGLLETIDIDSDRDHADIGARLSVQWVVRPISHEHHDYRGYAGRLTGGPLHPGDEVAVLPSGRRTTVEAIDTFEGPLVRAVPGQAITVRLAADLDVSRGDVIAAATGGAPTASVGNRIDADVCWMIDSPLVRGGRYLIKHGTRTAKVVVEALVHRLDVNTLEPESAPSRLELNDLGRVKLRLGSPVVGDPYAVSRATGRFILIDEGSNATAAAGMIRSIS